MILPDNRFTVILDANVLYPFLKRDILLRFFEAGFYKARWTNMITDEWVRNLIARKPEITDNVKRTERIISEAFPDAIVQDYEDLIAALVLPDQDDRHVLAAAIRCGAEYIVTENLKDFPANVLDRYGIEAGTADAFLASTFELFQQDAMSDLRDHRLGLAGSPSPSEYIMTLRTGGLPQYASRVKEQAKLL